MDDNKTYYPEEIEDSPLPGIEMVTTPSPSSSSNQRASGSNPTRVVSPKGMINQRTPQPIFADETLSSAINTKTRKILGEFQFTQFGAIKVGDFKEGVSGDVRISPEGIVGRNNDGLNYFTLNEDGILLTDGREATIVDAQGIRSTSQFQFVSLFDNPFVDTTETSMQDVPGSSFQLNPDRTVNVLFSLFANGYNSDVFTDADRYVDIEIFDDRLNDSILNIFVSGESATELHESGGFLTGWTYHTSSNSTSLTYILEVPSGLHNYKIRFAVVGGGTASLSTYGVIAIILGT